MRTTHALLTVAVTGILLLSTEVLAAQDAEISIRVVNADNEGDKVEIPENLRDVADILRQAKFKRYQLVKSVKKWVSPGEAISRQLTKEDRLVVRRGSEAEEKTIKVTIELQRYDKEKKEYVARKKVTNTLKVGGSQAVIDDRVRVNDKPTIIIVTYVRKK